MNLIPIWLIDVKIDVDFMDSIQTVEEMKKHKNQNLKKKKKKK